MTRADIRNLALDTLDDPNGTYFTSTFMNMRINLAQKELQKALLKANKQYYTKYVYTNAVIGQASYALPSDFIQLVRLEWVVSGSGDTADCRAITPATPNQRQEFTDISGYPIHYTFDKGNIVLSPVPSTAVVLRLNYSYRVADMSSDADIPDVPDQYVEYMPVLVARDCFLKDGRPLSPILEKLTDYKTEMAKLAEQRNIDRPRMVVMTGDN